MIALLLNAITEHYQAERGASPRLEHVTVVEEAHRLLARASARRLVRRDRRAKEQAAQSFANVLAENRKYGEGIVIAEQIPTKLIEDAVKNTNLKMMCRLTSEEERVYLGETMALSARESDMAARLRVGQAIVYSDEVEKALELRLPLTLRGGAVTVAANGARPAFAGVCGHCPRPCSMRGAALAIPETPGFAVDVQRRMRAVLDAGGDARAEQERALVSLLDTTLDRYPGLALDDDAGLSRGGTPVCAVAHLDSQRRHAASGLGDGTRACGEHSVSDTQTTTTDTPEAANDNTRQAANDNAKQAEATQNEEATADALRQQTRRTPR